MTDFTTLAEWNAKVEKEWYEVKACRTCASFVGFVDMLPGGRCTDESFPERPIRYVQTGDYCDNWSRRTEWPGEKP